MSHLIPSTRYAIDDFAMTEWLLARGASPNAGCHWDLTPLSKACANAPFPIIRLLFGHGGSVERGPLFHHAATRKMPDRIDVVAFLLDHGAPINAIKYQNRESNYNQRCILGLGTALHRAADQANVGLVKYLLSRGADPILGVHHQARARADPTAAPKTVSKAVFPPEEDYREVIRLLQPTWWSSFWSALSLRHDFTDGKRFT